jgi:hypothetical protein
VDLMPKSLLSAPPAVNVKAGFDVASKPLLNSRVQPGSTESRRFRLLPCYDLDPILHPQFANLRKLPHNGPQQ